MKMHCEIQKSVAGKLPRYALIFCILRACYNTPMNKYTVREEPSDKEKKKLETYAPLLQKILLARGIETAEDAHEFLNPNYDTGVHDPFLIADMDKAVKRILEAIKNKEHIVIYSDYDCDGVPGGVVLHDFFKKIEYKNFSNYIPHRHDEGFGLNNEALDKLAKAKGKKKAKVLITVDLGISNNKQVDHANELGIDVIITDHHMQVGDAPKAFAIINSKQERDTYPYDLLCGAGVAFKLVQGLLQKGNFEVNKGWEKWLLDMAGLSTIADMVPLTGENRVLAFYGLKVLQKSRRPGLQQLCKKIKVNQQHISEDDIGFMIAPRINAAGRMDHPMTAFNLLSTIDEVEGGTLSTYLDKLNNERKGVGAAMTKEVKKRVEQEENDKELIVMGNPDWSPTLLGLVANGLMETYKKPVFLWGKDGNGVIKGSCRSDGSVSLVELMDSIGDTLIEGGGHAFAGGFSMEVENVHHLGEKLIESYKKLKKSLDEEVFIDERLALDDVSWRTYSVIEKCAPFGVGNPKPTFLFESVKVEEVKHFGKDKNHLQLTFLNSYGKKVTSMCFFKTINDFDKKIEEGGSVSLVATMEKSMFRNFPELRLRIVDVY